MYTTCRTWGRPRGTLAAASPGTIWRHDVAAITTITAVAGARTSTRLIVMCAACGVAAHVPATNVAVAEPAAPRRRRAGSPRCATGTAGRTCSAPALAMMADNIEHVITYWVLWQKFHSPALAGFEVISHWVPFLLFSVYFGALADRFDCRRVIQAAQVLFMLVSAGLGRAVPDRLAADLEGLRAAGAARHGRFAVGAGRAADAARLRRHRPTCRARSGSTRRSAASASCSARWSARRCCSGSARPPASSSTSRSTCR